MESNNYEWFITQTVEAMLPRFSGKDILLSMIIDASWTDHGYAKDGNTKIREESRFRKEVLLLFQRPMNYTKVLYREMPDRGELRYLPKENTPFHAMLVADHDSCWRDMGGWIFKTFSEAWDFFDSKGVGGRDIDPSFHYSIFGGAPKYWKIKKLEKVDPSDHYCRFYNVELDHKIPVKDISSFMSQDAQE